MALIGLLTWAAALTGSETAPPFRSLRVIRPDLMAVRYENKTAAIRDEDSAAAHWKALRPARDLVWAINPEIAFWLDRLNRENRIYWKKSPTLFNWPVLASYEGRLDMFYFGPDFWKLSEGDKAAVIAHEYFHYKQNRLWMMDDTILEGLSGKLPEYGSRTEDEAHLYQWFAYRAMEMPPGDIVRGYFQQRKLYRFMLSAPMGADFGP